MMKRQNVETSKSNEAAAEPLTSLPWAFAAEIPGAGEDCALDAEEARHALGARRLRAGDEVALFDGAGTLARARVTVNKSRKEQMQVAIVDRRIMPPPRLRITLASALPRGDRLATLVGMATQLGMSEFVPLACERSVREAQRQFAQRIRRLMIEACKQSRRAHLPVLNHEETPAQLASRATTEGATLLAAHPSGPSLATSLPKGALSSTNAIAVMIGPEGGFTDHEIAAAAACGAQIVSLGPAVLRIETAAAALLAWIMIESTAGAMDGR